MDSYSKVWNTVLLAESPSVVPLWQIFREIRLLENRPGNTTTVSAVVEAVTK